MLMRSVVVHDDMDIQLACDVAVYVIEELEKLRMPMTRQTPLQHLAVYLQRLAQLASITASS